MGTTVPVLYRFRFRTVRYWLQTANITGALQPVATCRQSPAIVIVTSFSL